MATVYRSVEAPLGVTGVAFRVGSMDEPTRQLEVDAGAVAMEAGFEFGPGDPGDPAKLPALDDADRRFGFWLPSQLADAFENGLQNLGYQIISL